MNLYQLDSGHAYLVGGPDLFKDVTGREVGGGDDLRSSVPQFEWRGESRFGLREHRLFPTTNPGFVRVLGAYGRIKETLDGGRISVEFSAEADCEVMPGKRSRIVDLRVANSTTPSACKSAATCQRIALRRRNGSCNAAAELHETGE